MAWGPSACEPRTPARRLLWLVNDAHGLSSGHSLELVDWSLAYGSHLRLHLTRLSRPDGLSGLQLDNPDLLSRLTVHGHWAGLLGLTSARPAPLLRSTTGSCIPRLARLRLLRGNGVSD